MAIYDCFMFSHELDILEVRLATLYDHIDYFVITESDISFSGNKKPLHFKNNESNFKQWLDKIIYNKIDMPSDMTDAWSRERYSRNACKYVVKYDNNDVILSSDLDEIPKPNVVDSLSHLLEDNPTSYIVLQHSMYVNYLNNFDTNEWYGTRACKYSYLSDKEVSDLRLATENRFAVGGVIVEDAGWHFTSCGDVNFIRTKIESFSHTELNNDSVINQLDINLKNNNDVYGREKTYLPVQIDHTFPEYLLDNIDKYRYMIY